LNSALNSKNFYQIFVQSILNLTRVIVWWSSGLGTVFICFHGSISKNSNGRQKQSGSHWWLSYLKLRGTYPSLPPNNRSPSLAKVWRNDTKGKTRCKCDSQRRRRQTVSCTFPHSQKTDNCRSLLHPRPYRSTRVRRSTQDPFRHAQRRAMYRNACILWKAAYYCWLEGPDQRPRNGWFLFDKWRLTNRSFPIVRDHWFRGSCRCWASGHNQSSVCKSSRLTFSRSRIVLAGERLVQGPQSHSCIVNWLVVFHSRLVLRTVRTGTWTLLSMRYALQIIHIISVRPFFF
jgi:hypothetical protein